MAGFSGWTPCHGGFLCGRSRGSSMAAAHRRPACEPCVLPPAVLAGFSMCAHQACCLLPVTSMRPELGFSSLSLLRPGIGCSTAGHLHGACTAFVLIMGMTSFCLAQAAAGRRHGSVAMLHITDWCRGPDCCHMRCTSLPACPVHLPRCHQAIAFTRALC